MTIEDIVGVYTANHGKGLDILKINSDGTYAHLYSEKNKKTLVNRNRWSFEKVNNKVEGITFTDFHTYFRGKQMGGYWYTEIEYDLFGNIRFCLDPDSYYYYVKNTQPKETRKHQVVEKHIRFLSGAVRRFWVDTNRFPSMEEGLSVLVYPNEDEFLQSSNCNGTLWKGPYISPAEFDTWGKKDIWGTKYIYIYPSQHGTGDYDLYSCGKNRKDEFGKGDDITNWKEINLNYYDNHQ